MKYAPYSHSKINIAYICGLKFYYRYIAIGTRPSYNLAGDIGKAIHEFINIYINHLKSKGKDTDYEFADKTISSIANKFVFESSREDVIKICSNYKESIIFDPNIPMYTEMQLAVDKGWNKIVGFGSKDAYFRGYIDLPYLLIDHDSQQIIAAVKDYKTGFLETGQKEQIHRYGKMFHVYCTENWEQISSDLKKNISVDYPLSDYMFLEIDNLRVKSKSKGELTHILDIETTIKETDRNIIEIENMDFKGKISSLCSSCEHIFYCKELNKDDQGTMLVKEWSRLKEEYSNASFNIKEFVKVHGPIKLDDGRILDYGMKTSYEYSGRWIIEYLTQKAKEIIMNDSGLFSDEDLVDIKNKIYDHMKFNEGEFSKLCKHIGIKYDTDSMRELYAVKKPRKEFDFYEQKKDK